MLRISLEICYMDESSRAKIATLIVPGVYPSIYTSFISYIHQLYTSFIRPHLEYACIAWDPFLKKDITALEDVQKFALRLCTKSWDQDYQTLLTGADPAGWIGWLATPFTSSFMETSTSINQPPPLYQYIVYYE